VSGQPLPTVAFLDRDGTINRDVEYLGDPAQVELLPGAADAIRRLNDSNVPVVIVTNQSGIARGYFTEHDYARVNRRVRDLLHAAGAHVLASYHCPHHPDVGGACECRKPAAGMFRRAAQDHALDMARPAFIGDRWRDVAAALELHGEPIMIAGSRTPDEDVEEARSRGIPIVSSLAQAVDRILPHGAAPARARVAIVASGSGTNAGAIIEHFAALGPAASGVVALVASNRAAAGALERARRAALPAEAFDAADPAALDALLRAHRIDVIALAGYLKLVPSAVIARYRGRIVNVHPGPLPDFGGAGMYGERVHAAVIAAGRRSTEVTVHLVDERYDHGETLARWPVPVLPDDTPDTLAARVLAIEHILYPRIVDALAATVVRARAAASPAEVTS
jgi:histidinol-phosphate phosphatase family protein